MDGLRRITQQNSVLGARSVLYLLRRKGLAPAVGAGPSTGPGEEVGGAGWNCWERAQVCAAGTLEAPTEQWENKMRGREMAISRNGDTRGFNLKHQATVSRSSHKVLHSKWSYHKETGKHRMQHQNTNSMFWYHYSRTRKLFLKAYQNPCNYWPLTLPAHSSKKLKVFFQHPWRWSSRTCCNVLPSEDNHKPQSWSLYFQRKRQCTCSVTDTASSAVTGQREPSKKPLGYKRNVSQLDSIG